MANAGYCTMPGFITHYWGVRYHLKDHSGRLPMNYKELFNLHHSSLCTKIESTFGILKNRFKIHSAKPQHPFPSIWDIELACALHNYIATVDPCYKFLNEDNPIVEEDGDILDEVDDSILDFSQNMTQRQQCEAREE